MAAIRASNLGKCYSIYRQPGDRIIEFLTRRRRHTEKWALRNLYFEVEAGSILGVIGENGSGKSTLARILAGISDPTEGTIEVPGRVAGVLELGAGFHPDFTGRDNIRMNAAFNGFSGSDVQRMLPHIVAFGELGGAIDQPLRTYSTGMVLRLGFSIAIHAEADVLVFDEVLAVGDEYFRGKCFNRINQLHREGKAIVFVSHDMGSIRNLCSSVILLEGGRILRRGSTEEVTLDYIERMRMRLEGRQVQERTEDGQLRWGSGQVRIASVRTLNSHGAEASAFRTGEPMTIEASFDVRQDVQKPVFGNGVFRSDGTYVSGFNHLWHADPQPIDRLSAGQSGHVRCMIPSLPLLPGSYYLSYFCYDHSLPAPQPIDHIENIAHFVVLPGAVEEHGTVHIDSKWKIEV